jgi:spore coat polysaccharide biosynthesis protein SpsF
VQAIASSAPELVIRATADNPAVDIDASRRAIAAIGESGADYCHERSLPYGTVTEAIRTSALVDAAARATAADDREHVTSFIRRHPAEYRVIEPDAPVALRRPDLRLTVDTAQDLAFMRTVAGELPVPLATAPLVDIIAAADRVLAAARR